MEARLSFPRRATTIASASRGLGHPPSRAKSVPDGESPCPPVPRDRASTIWHWWLATGVFVRRGTGGKPSAPPSRPPHGPADGLAHGTRRASRPGRRRGPLVPRRHGEHVADAGEPPPPVDAPDRPGGPHHAPRPACGVAPSA